MPFGIRPSNVRVCHFTTRASTVAKTFRKLLVIASLPFPLLVLVIESITSRSTITSTTSTELALIA